MGGKTLLLAEDEMYVAMTLSDLLTEAGYRVLTAARLGDAIGVAERERIDCAILDINLHGEQVYPLCDRLRESGVPFFFTSAYGAEGLADEYRDVPMVPKPYTCDEVVEAIVRQMDGAADGAQGR